MLTRLRNNECPLHISNATISVRRSIEISNSAATSRFNLRADVRSALIPVEVEIVFRQHTWPPALRGGMERVERFTGDAIIDFPRFNG